MSNVKKSKQGKADKTNLIWGGRFSSGPSEIMEKINASVGFDYRLYKEDIRSSKAHTKMLVKQKIIPKKDGESILKGLDVILGEIDDGKFKFRPSLEDVHMNIETRLSELIGPSSGRMHTARSRNDQVATDFRMWVRSSLDTLDQLFASLQEVLILRAEENAGTIMPGYTHLQNAQPITLGHHLLAYVEMFGRDRGRAKDCRTRLNECPLGSGALAGTAYAIDREMTASDLDFDRPMPNSIDGVSDRDFAIEYLSTCSIACIHLSRLSEEIVLWSNSSFNFISLPDAFSTGSSMLPQKRNPDSAELVRAKTGRVIGALNNLLVVIKGLPLAYSKDLQEDKEPVFETTDTLTLCLELMIGLIGAIDFNRNAMKKAAGVGQTEAIELADWLVLKLGKPFREAHLIAGSIVKIADARGCKLEELNLADMKTIDKDITEDVFAVLRVETSVNSKISFGGTAPDNVMAACKTAKNVFLSDWGKQSKQ